MPLVQITPEYIEKKRKGFSLMKIMFACSSLAFAGLLIFAGIQVDRPEAWLVFGAGVIGEMVIMSLLLSQFEKGLGELESKIGQTIEIAERNL